MSTRTIAVPAGQSVELAENAPGPDKPLYVISPTAGVPTVYLRADGNLSTLGAVPLNGGVAAPWASPGLLYAYNPGGAAVTLTVSDQITDWMVAPPLLAQPDTWVNTEQQTQPPSTNASPFNLQADYFGPAAPRSTTYGSNKLFWTYSIARTTPGTLLIHADNFTASTFTLAIVYPDLSSTVSLATLTLLASGNNDQNAVPPYSITPADVTILKSRYYLTLTSTGGYTDRAQDRSLYTVVETHTISLVPQ